MSGDKSNPVRIDGLYIHNYYENNIEPCFGDILAKPKIMTRGSNFARVVFSAVTARGVNRLSRAKRISRYQNLTQRYQRSRLSG